MRCNGFAGFKCTMCSGEGQVQYSTSTLSRAKRSSIDIIAIDLLDGKEEVINYPPGYNAGYPLPYRKCPTCSGTGVSTCQLCKGYLSEPRLCFDNLMNVPSKTWNAHRRIQPPENSRLSELVKDRALAEFLLLDRHEIEGGFKIDEDARARVMARYQRNLEYDEIQEEVAAKVPGWEQLQEALYHIDSERAKKDPVVIQDVPHYKALKQVEAEVASLKVPPRPAEFTERVEPLLRKNYCGNDEEKAPLNMNEIKTLVEMRDNLIVQVLDAAWANEWRQKKIEEVVQDKINPFIEAEESGKAVLKRRPGMDEEVGTKESKRTDTKAASKKAEKVQKADKRKERQERLAKQAAEREAVLAKAKKK